MAFRTTRGWHVRAGVRGLEERLRNRLQHASRTAETRHSVRSSPGCGPAIQGAVRPRRSSQRHGDLPTRRAPSYPRPPTERQIIRHKSFSVAESEIDEAAFDMESLDYNFTCSPNWGPARTASCTAAAPPATGSLR
ncbi:sigma 54 modulation/S30EA ribosomal C-terminal domain-containing protein [Pseudonocardia xinjiangensis]|uniref:sigma 54 modulation/S30EA ribosomal C-terminal domain-containing protein n=1 Tax=Pseudonocardia xinjiangensis TaxID=75289 RepID=UPI003D8A4538